MNTIITQFKRELAEHRGAVVIGPIVISALLSLLLVVAVILFETKAKDLIFGIDGDVATVTYSEQSHETKNKQTKIVRREISRDGEVSEEITITTSSGGKKVLVAPKSNQIIIEEFISSNTDIATSDDAIDITLEDNEAEFINELRKSNISEHNLATITSGNRVLLAVFLVYAFFVVLVYSLQTLYNDRKDRSILFWKSMPISESKSTAVKLAFALFVIPGIALIAAWVTQAIYLLVSAFYLSSLSDASFGDVIGVSNYFSDIGYSLLAIITSAPWGAAVVCWLFAAGAFAKRSPVLLAVVPVVAISFVERLVFGTYNTTKFLVEHLPVQLSIETLDDKIVAIATHSFSDLFTVNFIFGALITAGLFASAVWARNRRFEL